MFSVDDFWQYLGVFSALVLSAAGLPIPEEVPIATGGILVGRAWNDANSGMHWWIMLPLCIVGVVVCDCLLYFIGRKWGFWLIQRPWVQRRVLPPAKRVKIEKNFHEYGIGILLVARLIPGIRGAVFITAGMIKLPFRKFLIADGLYAIPGVNIIFWLAFWYADSFMAILVKLEDYRHPIVIAALSFVGGFLTSTFLQGKASTGDPADIPVIGKQMANLSHHLQGESKTADGVAPVPPPTALPPDLNGELVPPADPMAATPART